MGQEWGDSRLHVINEELNHESVWVITMDSGLCVTNEILDLDKVRVFGQDLKK